MGRELPVTRSLPSDSWTRGELAVLNRLRTPAAIQEFLDSLRYSADPVYRCPRQALADRKAHCVDGALLGAAALRRIGFPPRIVWIDAENDDGHLLALFHWPSRASRRAGSRTYLGCVSKSNYPGTRYREPVYRDLRELVMSYFDEYVNSIGQRTMRAYHDPLDLSRYDHLNWERSDEHLDELIDGHLDRRRRHDVLPPGFRRRLLDVSPDRLKSALLGTSDEGRFVPKPPRRKR